MKSSLLFTCLFVLTLQLFAQEGKLPTNAVYVELGGPGLPYSFNYDFRFDKTKIDSWGMRIGAGGYAVSGGDSFFSLPVQINKLMGNGPHYFEIGGGATFVAFKSSTYSYCQSGEYNSVTGMWECTSTFTSRSDRTEFILPIEGSPNLMGTLNFGYRKVPTDGGFTWGFNLNPIFNSNGFWPLFGGIKFGYAF
ncbi:hypothetical protein [Pararhodonellum marinum]|uniref:hypothetical protein n=1 Tax=Pararhodonellum marinum TaxID=2755358 RepID=UPI0018901014|nr:hypothetical protein [Pararhodonellum marinum]